jgi:hypothetical protein
MRRNTTTKDKQIQYTIREFRERERESGTVID